MFKNLMKECDLVLTIIVSLLCIPFVLISPLNETPLRMVLGLPLVLFLSGYSLIAVLFSRINDLSGIERIALSFILSLAIVPFLGLVLNFTPFGIRLVPVLIVLATFTISLSFIALFRRLRLPTDERFRVTFERLSKFDLGKSILDKVLFIILIASIIGSSATLVYVAVTPKIGERFTEFYILDQNGTAFDYPTDLKVGEEGKVIISIVNHEYENITYLLEVNLNGSLMDKEYVFLNENETYESHFIFKEIKKEGNHKLEFILYKNQHKEAYRTLHLWINIT